MDESVVRAQLTEIKASLSKIDEEREILLSLMRAYESWLRLHGSKSDQPSQLALTEARPPRISKSAPRGSVSMRGAVLKVVRDARGEPLHVKEIWRRVQELGAATDSKNALGVIDLVLYSLLQTDQPIEKTEPRTWRWTGTAETNGH